MISTKITGTANGASITADTPTEPISNHTGHCDRPRRGRSGERVTTASEGTEVELVDVLVKTSDDPWRTQ